MTKAQNKNLRKYVPTIEVDCKEFVVVDDEGTKHYPYAGESIFFRRGVKMGVMRTLSRIRSMQAELQEMNQAEEEAASAAGEEDDSASAEAVERSVEILGLLIDAVFSQVHDWTLTSEELDEKGNYIRLPSPRHNRAAALEAMWSFDNDFLAFMQDHIMDGANVPNQ
jgi:hypothetical protein